MSVQVERGGVGQGNAPQVTAAPVNPSSARNRIRPSVSGSAKPSPSRSRQVDSVGAIAMPSMEAPLPINPIGVAAPVAKLIVWSIDTLGKPDTTTAVKDAYAVPVPASIMTAGGF